MGWLYTRNSTKAQQVKKIVGDYQTAHRVLKHRLVGNNLWLVVTMREPSPTWKGPGILLYLLEDGGPELGWGYKDLDESCHPFYCDCPLSFLAIAPEICAVWRTQVRAYHAAAHPKLEVGKAYAVTPGCWTVAGRPIETVVFESLRPLIGRINGQLTKIPRKFLPTLTCPA